MLTWRTTQRLPVVVVASATQAQCQESVHCVAAVGPTDAGVTKMTGRGCQMTGERAEVEATIQAESPESYTDKW